jgi:VWFA-related protein
MQFYLAAAFVLLLASVGFAQAPQVEPATPVISSRTDLVVVPVVVTDKRGNHISKLTKDDVRIEEDGRVQSVARFEEINSTTTPMRRAAGPVPNSFTNEVVGDVSSRVLVIIALDFLNTTWADEVFARRSLIKYLSESVKENTLVSLVTIDRTGLHQIHDFTTDTAVLVAALKRASTTLPRLDTHEQEAQREGVKAQERATVAEAEASALSALLNPDFIKLSAQPRIINAQAAASREAFAARTTLEALQHLAEAYAAVPGRKALIWATGSFPFLMHDPTEMSYAGLSPDVYQRTFQMLNDSNIAGYPVDLRGLSETDPRDANRPEDLSGSIASRAATLRASETPNVESLRELSLATLRSFADMTGGQAFYNANDLQQSMVKATADSSSYYLLTYYLTKESAKKSGWHKLKVSVVREGSEVRSRKGFFVSKATLDPETSRRTDEQIALDSPIDYTGMPMLLTWKDIQSGQKKNKAKFLLQVAPEVIRIQDSRINLDFLGVAKNDKGEPVAQFSQNLASNLSADGVRQIQTGGITYSNSLQLPPGNYSVRVVVRDNLTGLMGSVMAPLAVQ